MSGGVGGISEAQLSALLGTCIVPGILRDAGARTTDDIDRFYRSNVCQALGNTETGLWHLSTQTLADMYLLETSGQAFDDPEEQS